MCIFGKVLVFIMTKFIPQHLSFVDKLSGSVWVKGIVRYPTCKYALQSTDSF